MLHKVLDLNTNEVYDNVSKIVTISQQDKNTEYKIRMKKARKLNSLIAQHCGGFFFYRYDDLLNVVENNTAVAFRFLYLCASATDDGYFIKYNDEYCESRDDFTYIFDKPLRSSRRYVDELKEHNLLYKDDKGYRLNQMYYYCKIDEDDKKRRSVRTFRNCIKEMYKNSDPNEHSLMGELFKFVPYINIYNNVLCWYPEQPDKEKIQPLTLQEIRFIIRSNSTYGYTIENKLESLFVKGEPVFGRFESADEYHFIINPKLLYRGNDPDQFKALIDQFDIAKCQYLNKKKKQKLKKMPKTGVN